MDRYDDVDTDAGDGEVVTTELHYSPDVLVKAFALGPGAAVDPHEHPEQTNVFHVLEGDLVVVRGDEEERVGAPAVVPFERGVPHGARNESDETAVFTATMGPME
ncbi:quercetin dioxygenase-like cupin family protein [Halarchaeum solikamskense]|uniref:cupin domain-containing protein n=1 Tax=Halarchaeum nitratireducens TaxID=489913 RepID=UPI001B3B1B77|nr:cupin domain-containing protein [Halarchaeum solikamskense]MBP2251403.1 quercetin dioxygenase-like cupin family protein [Halarchaeum solikamskense]